MKQLAELVVELTGTKSPIVYEPLPKDDPKVRKPDITRARAHARLGAEGARAGRAGAHDRVFHEQDRLAADDTAHAAAAAGPGRRRVTGRPFVSAAGTRTVGWHGRAVYLSRARPEPIGLSRVPASLC